LLGNKKLRKNKDNNFTQKRYNKHFLFIKKDKGRLTGNQHASSSQQAILQVGAQSGDPLYGLLGLRLSESMTCGIQKESKYQRQSQWKFSRSWDLFGSFWKLIKSSDLKKRLGPRTVPVTNKGE
jgi:hypothetical protein